MSGSAREGNGCKAGREMLTAEDDAVAFEVDQRELILSPDLDQGVQDVSGGDGDTGDVH